MVDDLASRAVPALYGGVDVGLRPETRAQVYAALTRGEDPVVVAEVVGRQLDACAEQLMLSVEPEVTKPACAKGCFSCCHSRVEVTAPEVFLLARGLVGVDASLVHEAIARVTTRVEGMNGRDYHLAQVRCALLDAAGACTVYGVRPLACRRAQSTDRGVCERAHRNPTLPLVIPSSAAFSWNLSAVTLGYYEGSAHAGYPPHLYELHAALRLALSLPNAEARFFSGEDLLAPACSHRADELPHLLGHAVDATP